MSDFDLQGKVVLDGSQPDQVFGKIEQGASRMAQAVGRSGQQASDGLKGLGDTTEKLTASQQRLLESLKKQSVVASEGKAAYLELRAAQAGVSDQAAGYIAKIKQAEQGQVALGVSAKQTAAALRGVPAQFTDIVTSIQGGQKPLTVLLQQGGQLKDMFGGIGPAARALGSYIGGMVNPLTLAIGAVAGLAFAWHEGSKEAQAFQNALTISGNAVGLTLGQFEQMRDAVAALNGITKGGAAEALTAIAQNGKIAGENIRSVAEAAVLMERATGQAVKKTVDEFSSLGDDPVKAAAKLNEQYNFLTLAVYQQIKALQDQGRETEAAKLATETLADATKSRASAIVDNVGLIEKAWRGVVNVIKQAGDTALAVGRQQSTSQQLASVRAEILAAQGQDKNRPFRLPWETSLKDLQDQEGTLKRILDIETSVAEQTVKQAAQVKARVQFDKEGEQFLSKREKMEREITQARANGLAAGASQVEIEKRIGEIREKYKETTAAGNKELDQQAKLLAKLSGLTGSFFKDWDALSAAYKRGAISLDQLTQLQDELLSKQPAIKAANDEEARSFAALSKAQEEAAAAREKYISGLVAGVDKIRAEVAAEQDYAARLGLTKEAVRLLDAEKLELLATTEELIAKNTIELDDGERRVILAKAQAYRDLAAAKRGTAAKESQLEIEKASQDAAKKAQEDWQKASDDINRSLTDALLRGFESGKDFAQNLRDTLKNMFATLVLRPTISAIMNPVAGVVNSFVQQIMGGITNGIGSAFGLTGGTSTFAGAIGNFFSGGSSIGGPITMAGAVGPAAGATLPGSGAAAAGAGASALGVAGIAAGILAATVLDWKQSKQAGLPGYTAILAPGVGPTTLLAQKLGLIQAPGGPKSESGFSGGLGNVPVRGDPTAATQAAQNISAGYTALAQQLGLTKDQLDVGVFFALDNAKGGTAKTQLQVASSTYSRATRLGGFENVEPGDEAFHKELADEAIRVIYDGLIHSDLDERFKDYLDDIDLSSAATDLQARIDDVLLATNVSKLFEPLGAAFDEVQGFAVTTAKALVETAGGLEALTANLGTYYANFYSAEEQRAKVIEAITGTLTETGVDIASLQFDGEGARQSFRDIVESLDLSTESGQKAFAAFMSVSGAFASITDMAATVTDATDSVVEDVTKATTAIYEGWRRSFDAVSDLAQRNAAVESDYLTSVFAAISEGSRQLFSDIQGEIDRIRGGMLTQGSLGDLQKQFDQATVAAQAGDNQAAARLPQLAEALLQVAGTQAVSVTQLQSIQAGTAQTLQNTLGVLRDRQQVATDQAAAALRGVEYVPRSPIGGLGRRDSRVEQLLESATAELKAIREKQSEANVDHRRAADALNGRPERPMPVKQG